MTAGITFPLPIERDAFRSVHRRLPVARVRSAGPTLDLATPASSRLHDLDAALTATWTDAFVVWHDGAIVHETYLAGNDAEQPHLLQSVTKSFVGAIAGRLAADRAIVLDRPVDHYVVELGGTGYGSATLRDLLDMRSGVDFVCDYSDAASGWAGLSRASGWIDTDQAEPQPEGQHEFLRRLRLRQPHGGAFEYRSSETSVLAWVCESATGSTLAELLSELIWTPIGAGSDGYVAVDGFGAPLAERGLCATARDVVRFAAAWLDDGLGQGGSRVLAAGWAADTASGDASSRQAFEGNPARAMLGSTAHYRNQVWVASDSPAILYFTGIHGQLVMVDQANRLVVVKLSTQPNPSDVEMMRTQLALVDTVRQQLAGGR